MASISVLVPTYKNAHQLRETLSSLVAHNIWFQEIIIGDDGGDKETKEVIDEFRSRIELIHHLPPEGKGCLPLNIIRMVKAATGDWVYLIHSDDRWLGLSEKTFQWLDDPSVDFLFTDHGVISDDGKLLDEVADEMATHYGRDQLNSGKQRETLALGIGLQIGLDGFFARRSCALGIEVDRKHVKTGDWLWVLKVLSRCRAVVYSNERSFEYRLSSQGLTSMGSDRSLTFEMLLEVDAKTELEKKLITEKRSDLAASACWDYLLKKEYEKAGDLVALKLRPTLLKNRLKLKILQGILYFPYPMVKRIVFGLSLFIGRQRLGRLNPS